MAETKFDKDKEKKDIYKHFLSILVALIISLTGGLVSLISSKSVVIQYFNFIVLIGFILLIIFIVIFIKFAVSLYKLIKKFD